MHDETLRSGAIDGGGAVLSARLLRAPALAATIAERFT
jgi:hypothetical protein